MIYYSFHLDILLEAKFDKIGFYRLRMEQYITDGEDQAFRIDLIEYLLVFCCSSSPKGILKGAILPRRAKPAQGSLTLSDGAVTSGNAIF